MMKLYELDPAPRSAVLLWMLCICLGYVFCIIRLWQQHRSFRPLAPVLALFAVSDALWQLCAANTTRTAQGVNIYPFEPPIIILLPILAALSVAAVLLGLKITAYQQSHICAMSVKESLDDLPAGVCFYDTSGRIYLINRRMDLIAQKLTGVPLQNGLLFPDAKGISDTDNERIINAGGEMLSLRRYKTEIYGETFYELIASDITEEYRKAELLMQKNKELEQLAARLRSYSSSVNDITREREIAKAKAGIHERMNMLLLSTSHCLDTRTGFEDILHLWRGNILMLGSMDNSPPAAPLRELKRAADAIGLTLELHGELPSDRELLKLFMSAAGECLMNAAQHAGASHITIIITDNEIRFYNDGAPPASPITEGGGLSYVRRRAEAAGAAMTVTASPRFELKIRFGSAPRSADNPGLEEI